MVTPKRVVFRHFGLKTTPFGSQLLLELPQLPIFNGVARYCMCALNIISIYITLQQESNDMLESELVRVRDQDSQLANEMNQLNNTVAELRDQLASAEQDITLLKQEALQLQEDNRNKTCASFILIFENVISYIHLASVTVHIIRYDLI